MSKKKLTDRIFQKIHSFFNVLFWSYGTSKLERSATVDHRNELSEKFEDVREGISEGNNSVFAKLELSKNF